VRCLRVRLSIDKQTRFEYIALMEKNCVQGVLVAPYPLMEPEATYWSLLLFGPLVFLHPYSLVWPDPYRELLAEGLVQVLAPDRTPEEIREKDKRVREFQSFVAQNPDFSFLESLRQVKPGEPLESRDEILDLLRGQPSKPRERAETRNPLTGELFLCLIHDWLNKEWEIDLSLDKYEVQERGLARIMDESPEFSVDWASAEKSFITPNAAELVCPPALTAWKGLRERLLPEAGRLITNQPWVRREHYALAYEEFPSPPLPLPDLRFPSFEGFLASYRRWSQAGVLSPLRKRIEDFFSKPGISEKEMGEFLAALNQLNLKGPGRYSLYLPPPALPSSAPEPLLLIASA
jgi:hypothetical protein